MKNLILSPLTLILVSLLTFSTPSFGGQKDSLYTIEVDGKVLIPNNDPNKTYKVELLCHNTVVETGVTVDGESFLLKVKKNSWYTIRIVKEGYFQMSISMDTRLPEYDNDTHKFHFDTELMVENYSSIQDQDAIDFPIAIVSFNKKNDQFMPVKEYSKNIKSSLFDMPVIKESYAKR